jgi:phage repressor protein C with HTH and peptisase S24 domain
LKTTIKERIKLALDRSGKSLTDLARHMGLQQPSVSGVLNREGELDSLKYLEAASELTGYSFDWLHTGEGAEKKEFGETAVVQEVGIQYLNGKSIRPVTVTVDPAGQEMVTYVPVKAQAGYPRGYGDPHFIETLPAFNLPGVIKDGTYRMFEVAGDSMLQLGSKGLHNGDIVIAKYVEDIFEMKDNRVYVVVGSEGIAIKRVINRLKAKDKNEACLVMMSDNKNGQHDTYTLRPGQISEVWEARRMISADFSFDTNLYEILGDLQAQTAMLKDEVNKLKKK